MVAEELEQGSVVAERSWVGEVRVEGVQIGKVGMREWEGEVGEE